MPIFKKGQSKSMCRAKLHRVTVKQADLNSVGSITIDEALLEASGIEEYLTRTITNVSNAAILADVRHGSQERQRHHLPQ
jgi:aspartate 1-decarboxylase